MFQKIGKFHVIFERTSKIYIKTKFPGSGVLFFRYCIQLQIEWYQPPICIFSVCGEITKIISKMFQKIGKFHVIFEKTSKKCIKTKLPGWGVLFSRYCLQLYPSRYRLFGLSHGMNENNLLRKKYYVNVLKKIINCVLRKNTKNYHSLNLVC